MAWKEGLWAGDSLVTNAGIRRGLDRKVHIREWDGTKVWFGFCGIATVGQHFVDLVYKSEGVEAFLEGWASFEGRKAVEDKFEGVLVWDEAGQMGQKAWLFYEDFPYSEIFFKDFLALGSGREFAMGAMAGGLTAVDAVGVACRFDTGSGPPVQWISTAGEFCVV